jgi:hypothetical protein
MSEREITAAPQEVHIATGLGLARAMLEVYYPRRLLDARASPRFQPFKAKLLLGGSAALAMQANHSQRAIPNPFRCVAITTMTVDDG